MHNKLILVLIGLMLLLGGGTAGAGEKQDVKASKQDALPSSKCWKRISPSESPGNDPICHDFAKVLNTTCELPDKLRCDWMLPPGEKRFKKVEWRSLDWREHRALIRDFFDSGVREDLRESYWKTEGARIAKEYEDNYKSLWITQIDIDRDGIVEQIVRDQTKDCLANGSMGVIIPETGRLNWKFANHMSKTYLTDGAEIILYYGQPFIFTYTKVRNLGIVSIFKYFRYEQCRFSYQK